MSAPSPSQKPCTVRRLACRPAAALFALAVACTSGAAGADIYTFVDGEGTLHFTNVPSRDSRFKLYLHTRDRRRAGGPGSPPGSAPTDLPADRFERYESFITEAAALYQIPEGLVRAVIKVESNYD